MPRTIRLALFALLTALLPVAATNVARAELLYGLTEGQQLVTFDSVARSIASNVQISGLGGDTLIGIDFRPSTGELYGFSSGNQFYKINTATGAASTVGSGLFLIDIVKSFDFDPVNDNIRLLTNQRKNLVVNPNTGALSSTDALLNYAIGDPNAGTAPQVVQGAYSNSYAGATTTTLYNLEAAKDVLTMQLPQATGTLSTIGSLGADLGTLLSFNGMDISGLSGIGYVVGQSLLPGGLVQNTLYTIDLGTGALELAGNIEGTPNALPLTFGGDYGGGGGGGGGHGHGGMEDCFCDCGGIPGAGLLIDVATVPVPEPSSFVLAGLGMLAIGWTARRKHLAAR